MNQGQFIATALTFPTDISIWYTQSSPFHIQGIMIPIINANNQNIVEYLEESTQLTIEIQTGIVITLQISQGQLLQAAPGGQQLYYFDVLPPYDITGIVNSPTFTTRVAISTITFINAPNQYEFNASGYSVLLNNVEDSRTSQYQYLGQTGVLANVQDSLYSSTGWINGRYEGSQTTQTGYLGISPTLAGKSFQGVYFPRTVTDAQIISQVAAGEVTSTEYLYTGQESLPTYIPITGSYEVPFSISGLAVGTIPATDTIIPMVLRSGVALSTAIPQIDDVIQVTSSLELMKIKQIDSYADNGEFTRPLYKLTVERGYNYTTPQPIVTNAGSFLAPPINLVNPSLIFKLQGNKVQGAQRGKLQVQTSGEILHIDRFGFVLSGSNQGV
jgi:hypothetical protein